MTKVVDCVPKRRGSAMPVGVVFEEQDGVWSPVFAPDYAVAGQ
jgi:hypothetical protein